MTFPRLAAALDDCVRRRATPAIVCEVGRREGPLTRVARGALTYEADAAPCRVDTLFDLASLTKVIATSSLALRLVAADRVRVDTLVRDVLPEWGVPDSERVTVGHLLDHSSGLPAHVRLWREASAETWRDYLLHVPLERPVGAASVYSDAGFLLLGLVLERLAGPLDRQWEDLWPRDYPWLDYRPPAAWRARIAPTEIDPWRGRLLQGEVHDENAALLGGVAPHAGLFGTAEAVGRFALSVLASLRAPTWLAAPDLLRVWIAPRPIPGSSRALGWDTMRPTSSCGTRLSPRAFGHTGFTGTSLWIDPDQDLYVVLLSNRVHPTRDNAQFPALRGAIHDAIVADL